MKTRLNLSILSLSIICALNTTAFAESTTSELPTIVVKADKKDSLKNQMSHATTAAKNIQNLKDVPQTVNVVTNQIMREQGVTSMEQAVMNVPGVSVSAGDGQRDQTAMRGFVNIYDYYVDGFRDDAMYFRDMSNVDRIEVVKGPAAVLYGRGSSGGIVNRITKKPMDQSLHEVSLMTNTFGQRRAEVDMNEKLSSTVSVRLTGAVEDSDGYTDSYFLKRQAVSPSVLWKPSDQTQVLFQVDYLHDDRVMAMGVPYYTGSNRPANLNRKTFLGTTNAKDSNHVDSEVSSATTTVDHKFSDTLKYHGVVHVYQYDLDRQMISASAIDPTTRTLKLSQSRLIRDERGTSTQHELSDTFTTGSIKHETLVGFEYDHQDKSYGSNSGNSTTVDLGNLVLPTWSSVNMSGVTRQYEKYSTTGLYLQDLVSFTDQIKAMIGIRYDNLEQNRVTAKGLELARTDDTWSPRAGLIYQPLKDLSFYASYSKSYQPLADGFINTTNVDDLSPSMTENYEIGAKWDVIPDLNLGLSIFDTKQSNIVETDSATNLSENAGTQRSKGIELSFAGNITDQLSVTGGYAYLNSKMIDGQYNGKHAALAPKNMATIWAKYQFNEQWFAALGGRAESARYANMKSNQVVLPGYGVINAAVGYHQDKYDVTVNLNNILDKKYFVSAHGNGADTTNVYGDAANAQLTLRYRF